jgi:hypothetical protein
MGLGLLQRRLATFWFASLQPVVNYPPFTYLAMSRLLYLVQLYLYFSKRAEIAFETFRCVDWS